MIGLLQNRRSDRARHARLLQSDDIQPRRKSHALGDVEPLGDDAAKVEVVLQLSEPHISMAQDQFVHERMDTNLLVISEMDKMAAGNLIRQKGTRGSSVCVTTLTRFDLTCAKRAKNCGRGCSSW